MAQWVYNIFAEQWINVHGYTYNPVNSEMRHGPDHDVVEIVNVPQFLRDELEQTAFTGINQILTQPHQVPELPETGPIDHINITFDQEDLNGMNGNVTIDGSFGSVGAASCLIVFAVARLQIINQAQVMARGYHLTNQVTSYAASVQVIQAMTAPPLNGNAVRFYVIGGEIGHITNPLDDNLTMDYSRYYPFFKACADQQVVFGGYKFPAGNGETAANAAITTTDQQEAVINLWIN